MAGVLEMDDLQGLFQPKVFSDSAILTALPVQGATLILGCKNETQQQVWLGTSEK